ncbi:hypothetical protein [Allopontixanthobacter sp.]|uniref:hypothetical protein n=1 Tax=Allopontixanthobacter sp. TaxID=2906452 RepID=UPI002AB9A686|nr:hypothetical protein [Allopontixanthobacter sp.]MDZ4306722.1 hypothetical protein [Allopontixanthobacter sp.]
MTRPQPTAFEREREQRMAILAGFASYTALFEPVRQTPGALFRYGSESLPAISTAFIVHIAVSCLMTVPARRGGYQRDASGLTKPIPVNQTIYRKG